MSDDLKFSTIYEKLFDLLMIDKLFKDIEECSDKMGSIIQTESEKHEKNMSDFMVAISFLTLASVLIDLSSYLDRLSETNVVSPIISGIITAVSLVIMLSYILKKR